MYPISDFLGIKDVVWTGFPEAIGIIMLIFGPILIARLLDTILNTIFRIYNQKGKQLDMTGREVVEKFIHENQINADIRAREGILSDCYDSDYNTIWLSNEVYYGRSPAAYAVGLHEAGHAIQHKEAFKAERFRSAFSGSALLFALVAVFGTGAWILLGWNWSLTVTIISLGIYLLINIITVTSEVDASRRAKNMLRLLDVSEEEYQKCKRMLGLCYGTYIISILSNLSTIVLLLIVASKRKKA